MNQLFLSNPELIGSIKFTKLEDEKLNANHLLSNIPDPLTDDLRDHNQDTKKQNYLSEEDSPTEGGEDRSKNKSTGKFWETISREMTREHKGSKIPTIKRINHVLNIFKATIEKPEQKYDLIDVKPPPRSSSMGGAIGKDKKKNTESLSKGREDDFALGKPAKSKNEPVEDDGIVYYSFKKKMQLKLKEKQQNMKEQQKLVTELAGQGDREDNEEQSPKKTGQMKSEYSDIMGKGDPRRQSMNNINTTKVMSKAPSSNDVSKQSIIRPKTGKPGGMSVVERLTKDIFHGVKVVSEEELLAGKEFKFKRAKELYLEKKRFGDTDAFESGALKKIKNFKREFNEKVANNKAALFESVKFTKEKKARKYNLFTPDFDRVSGISEAERDMIFASHDFTKIHEFGDNPETQGLAKINKILEGNIIMFWKSAKEAAL